MTRTAISTRGSQRLKARSKLDAETGASFGAGWWLNDKALLAEFYAANEMTAEFDVLNSLATAPTA